jgi:hypothetical protein
MDYTMGRRSQNHGFRSARLRGMKSRMIRCAKLLAAGAYLSACSITLPVRGQMDDGTETFVGRAVEAIATQRQV